MTLDSGISVRRTTIAKRTARPRRKSRASTALVVPVAPLVAAPELPKVEDLWIAALRVRNRSPHT